VTHATYDDRRTYPVQAGVILDDALRAGRLSSARALWRGLGDVARCIAAAEVTIRRMERNEPVVSADAIHAALEDAE
jgi:hypothetical protein